MRIKIDQKVIEHNKQLSPEDILNEFDTVKRAVKDPAQFQILYDRYFNRIFNYIYRRIDDEDITADLTSQTFFKALRNLKNYKFKGVPLSAWLYRIASNEVNRHYRQTNKRIVFSFDEHEFENLIDRNMVEEQQLDIEYVILKMQSLCKADIEVLELRFFESKSFEEIAYILDLSESNAKMRTYRAIEKLKKLLKGAKDEKI